MDCGVRARERAVPARSSTMVSPTSARAVDRITMALPRTTEASPSMSSNGPADVPGIRFATTAVDNAATPGRLVSPRTKALARPGSGRSSGLVTAATSQPRGTISLGISDRPVTPVTRLTDRTSVPSISGSIDCDARTRNRFPHPVLHVHGALELHRIVRAGLIQELHHHHSDEREAASTQKREQVTL